METFLAAQTERLSYLWDLVSQTHSSPEGIHILQKMCLYILILLHVCKFL